VFLDIDDVLCVHRTMNTRQVLAALRGDNAINAEDVWQQIFHASARGNLRQLHDEFEPLYVISSSWTLHLNHEQLCQVFRLTGLEFVAENLHQHWQTPRDEGNSYRLVEIENWLDIHTLLTPVPFVVIDDVVSGQSIPGSHLEERTVLCEAWSGFMFKQLAQARSILQAQLASPLRKRD
jgi:hypothetical protein